jgi:molybdopterin converting factor small subunit
MQVSVRLFAVLKERAGRGEIALSNVPDEIDVAGLKREIARRHPELGDLSSVAAAVGTQYAADDTRVRAGDVIALLPPVSGG